MTAPEQGSGRDSSQDSNQGSGRDSGTEPPTASDPLAPGTAMPAPQPWVAPQPFFAPGSAAVPQQPSQPAVAYDPSASYQPSSYQPPSYQPSAYEPATSFDPAGFGPPGYGASPGYSQPGYPPQGYPVGAYPPPRKRRTGLIVGIVAIVLVLCVGGSIGGGLLIARTLDATADGPAAPLNPASPQVAPSSRPTPATSPATSPSGVPSTRPTASVSAPAGQHFGGDLRELLLPRPAGTVPWKDFKDADGKLTLAETKGLFTSPDAVGDELSSYHFERGAVTHWGKGNVFVLIFLFQFDTATDAKDYVTAQRTDGIKDYETQGEFGLIPNSVLLVDDTADKDADRSTILISSRGDIVSYVTMWHPDAIDLPAATALAVAQHNRLPS